MKVAFAILALAVGMAALFLFSRQFGGNDMVQRVNGSQAKELVAGGATLLDVRTPEEYAGGAIDGAKNISVQTLPGRIAEVGDKDTPIVVYCRSGVRSANAAGMLTQAGYTKVYDLGGIGNW